MKRLISILLFSFLCLSLNALAGEQVVNLAGTWILDSKNSDPFFRPMPNLGAPQLGGNPVGGDMDGGTLGATPASRDTRGGMPDRRPSSSMPGVGRGPQSTAPNAPMIIEQKGNELRISRTSTIMGKETPVRENYVLDGVEHAQTTQIPGSPDPVKVVTSAKLKKKSMLVRIITYNPKNKVELRKEFLLSKDGRTLTVKSSSQTPMGAMIQDQIYHKQ
jgi:hypothetical protein